MDYPNLPSVNRSAYRDSGLYIDGFVHEMSQFYDFAGTSQSERSVVGISSNNILSSFNSFYVTRPKPVNSHEATRFSTRTYVSNTVEQPIVIYGDNSYSPGEGYYTFTGISIKINPKMSLPFYLWSYPLYARMYQLSGSHPGVYPVADSELQLVHSDENPSYEGISIDYARSIFTIEPSYQFYPDFSRHDNLARSSLSAKIAEGDVNLSVFAVELPQSIQWLALMGIRIAKAVSALIRLDFPGAIRALRIKQSRRQRKGISDLTSWDDFILEYNYALTPLLSDLYGMLEAVVSGFRTKGQLIHAHSFSADEPIKDFVQWKTGVRNAWGHNHMQPATYDLESPSYGVRYDVTYKVVNPTLRTLQEMGLVNPLDAIWERVPFSFLIDWLFNFNVILQSTTAGSGVEFVDGSKTTYILGPLSYSQPEIEVIQANALNMLHDFGVGPEFGGEFEITLPSSYGNWLSIDREPLTGLSLDIRPEQLAIKVNPFSSDSRILNFIALLSKALKS